MEKPAYSQGQKPRNTLYLTLKNMFTYAAIGEEVSLDIFSDHVTGILEGIDSNGITLRIGDSQQFYPANTILMIDRSYPAPDVMTSEAHEFLRATDALLQYENLSIPVQYAQTFSRFIPYSMNMDFIELFQQKRTKNVRKLDQKTKQAMLAELDLVCRRIGDLPQDEYLAARAFIHFAARDYTKGMQELLQVCLNAADQDSLYCLLPLACYCADLRHRSLALYWLGKFFSYFPPMIDEKQEQLVDSVWVYYLKSAVAQNYFDELKPLLERLFQEYPKTALISVAYMYLLQHAYDMGRLLLGAARSELDMITLDRFRMYCLHLSTSPFDEEHYGTFYRFRMRMDEILSKEHPLYTSYADGHNGDLMGFVYEYIPNSGYCRVLGFDTMIYFWHFDNSTYSGSNQTQYLIKTIENQMCSMQPVEDEQAVRIRFRAIDGQYANRGYAVTDVQIE